MTASSQQVIKCYDLPSLRFIEPAAFFSRSHPLLVPRLTNMGL